VVDDLRALIKKLFDLPSQVVTDIVFDQSVFVRQALSTVLHEGLTGLFLTSFMILIFLGSMRAIGAVLLSIPISVLATFVVLNLMGSSINTMILGGLALALSRAIDNSVISLENIYRHLEMGSSPAVAAEQGGAEVNLAVLAATLVDVVDFFPVTLLFGVSKFLFSALALSFCLESSALSAGPRPFRRSARRRSYGRSEPAAKIVRRTIQFMVQSRLQSHARRLRGGRPLVPQSSRSAGRGAGRRIPREPADLSFSGPVVFPTNRCRPVHGQHQSADRHASRSDRSIRRQDRRCDPPHRPAQRF